MSKNAIRTVLAAPIMLMIDTNIHTMIVKIITNNGLYNLLLDQNLWHQ
jgi:hypothetical protein